MAARGQPRVSLFPFMSVLACTIGALTLLLVAMSLAAVGRTDAATRAYVETKRLTVADREQLDAELDRLTEAEEIWSQVDEALVARGLAAGISQSTIDREIDRARRRAVITLAVEDIEAQTREIVDERNSIETTIDVLPILYK